LIKANLFSESEGKFAPLLNKVQFQEGVFGGGEIALSIINLNTKWK
jgi:hypothetical protein